MKYVSLLLLSIPVFAGILLSGCKDSTTNSNIPGDIIGTLYGVYDTLYVPMADMSGVKVSLERTPYFTISDATGKWHLTNIPAGTYTIKFSKDHYVSTTRQNLVFGGNGTFFYNAAGNSGYTAMYP